MPESTLHFLSSWYYLPTLTATSPPAPYPLPPCCHYSRHARCAYAHHVHVSFAQVKLSELLKTLNADANQHQRTENIANFEPELSPKLAYHMKDPVDIKLDIFHTGKVSSLPGPFCLFLLYLLISHLISGAVSFLCTSSVANMIFTISVFPDLSPDFLSL